MIIREFQPLGDQRWSAFLAKHPGATVFHTPAWLTALHRTYGFEPAGLMATGQQADPRNALVFCRIRSRLTGKRLVSLPFSDHCEPLVDTQEEFGYLADALRRDAQKTAARYIELRVIRPPAVVLGFQKSNTFCFHRLDLRPTLEEIFRRFQKDCIQRKIQRAEREQLSCTEGASELLLKQFYWLLVQSRRRQGVPPQPLAWFRNLIACMGSMLKISVASKGGEPIAAILTLRFKNTLTYKYGCMDRRFGAVGGTHLLFWNAIRWAQSEGLTELDMGRTDWDNEGLIRFKDRLGATRSTLTYWRHPASSVPRLGVTWKTRVAKRIFSHLPDRTLIAAGNLLYRHMG